MIHKPGKPKQDLTSYRPISLLLCLAKLMEKIIKKKITAWAESSGLLPPEQSGFRGKRSCHDHILRLTQQITDGFNNPSKKLHIGAVFFDLEKEFDGILNKLEKHNLNPCLIGWVKSFLSERTFQVNWLNNRTDSSLKVIETKLQTAINAIEAFSNCWGLILGKKKTFYTVFCTAGHRTNFYRT